MTFSSLTSRTVWSNKYDSRQGNRIEYLIVHSTMGGNDESNVVYLATNPVQVSANYVLQTTGRLVGLVPEEYRAWTTGWYADKNGVTVETVNTVNRDPWPISREQSEKIAQLLADLCLRYGWGKVDESRIRFHYQFMNTSCPGPYVKSLRQDFITRANQIVQEKEDDMPLTNEDIQKIAAAVWAYNVQVQDEDGIVQKKNFPAWGFLSSTNAQVNGLLKRLKK